MSNSNTHHAQRYNLFRDFLGNVACDTKMARSRGTLQTVQIRDRKRNWAGLPITPMVQIGSFLAKMMIARRLFGNVKNLHLSVTPYITDTAVIVEIF